jgi:hypothetical protein
MSDASETRSSWADGTVLIHPDNLLWKQYTVYVDLFKFYVDITWKSTTWFYAITGAILVYYFDNANNNNPFLKYSLLLPIVLSFALCAIYFLGASQTKELEQRLCYIREQLRLAGSPHVNVLRFFLWAGSGLCLVVGMSIFFVFIRTL